MIIHIINSAHRSGAERSLLKLCTADIKVKQFVFFINRKGELLRDFEKYEIYKNGSFLSRLVKLIIYVFANRHQLILQGWLSYSMFLAHIISIIASTDIIYSLRNSDIPRNAFKERNLRRILKFLTFIKAPHAISVSHASINWYQNAGFRFKRKTVIWNPLELQCNYPMSSRDRNQLDEIRSDRSCHKVFFLGRNGKNKNVDFILNNLKLFDRLDSVSIFFVGRGFDSGLDKIEQIGTTIIKIFFRPAVDDVYSITSEIDLCIQPSAYGEGYPNIIAELAVLNIPVLATDVGDARYILKDNYIINLHEIESVKGRIAWCLNKRRGSVVREDGIIAFEDFKIKYENFYSKVTYGC